ncbi:MAG: SRPBCC domain-containing protein, partial [Gemmatimonadetes bacterium]|nr:SRPBCC domain-containing protein [Gemmatimonadota bacterium]
TYDWSRFELVYYYDRPLPDVFRAWATAAGLESFFIEEARAAPPDGDPRGPSEVVQEGDVYHWRWRHGHELDGVFTRVVDNEQVSFTFGSQNVSVFFTQCGEQTEVHLVQFDIPDTDAGVVFGHLNCRSCWIYFLVNLKAVLDGGGDLRDTDPDRVSSIEVGFRPLSTRDAASRDDAARDDE